MTDTTEPLTEEQAMDSLMESPESNEPEATETEETLEAEADETPEVEDAGEADPEETSEGEDEPDEDNEDNEDADEGEEPVAELFDVKVNGETQQVPISELQNNYAGRAALQMRHEELKSRESEFSQAAQSLHAERQAVLQAFQAMQNGISPAPQPPDPNLAETDPIGYMQENAKFQEAAQNFQAQQQQIAFVQQQQAEAEQAQTAQMRQVNKAKLLELVPEFSDPKRAAELQQELIQVGMEYGFSPEAIRGWEDAGAIAALNDALKWRKLQSSKGQTAKKVQNARPVMKPGAKKTVSKARVRKDAIGKAMATQSTDAWADALAID